MVKDLPVILLNLLLGEEKLNMEKCSGWFFFMILRALLKQYGQSNPRLNLRNNPMIYIHSDQRVALVLFL